MSKERKTYLLNTTKYYKKFELNEDIYHGNKSEDSVLLICQKIICIGSQTAGKIKKSQYKQHGSRRMCGMAGRCDGKEQEIEVNMQLQTGARS